mmetsp:Transcript_44882/g.100899  ORF Transcript_44882/g.100899 Transcript_44882/m.100899 type:complete len:297 (-) Transcript_44882:94-984(-)
MAWVEQLPREESQDDLDREGAAVHKIAVEQVGVCFGWHAIDLPDVEKVVELAMHVSTNCDLAVVGDFDVHQRGEGLQQLNHVHDDGVGALLGYGLLLLLPLHELLAELRRELPLLVDGAVVRGLYVHAAHVQGLAQRHRLLASYGSAKLLLIHLLLALLQLVAGVLILGDQLAELGEVSQGILGPSERQVGGAPPVPPLGECLVCLDGLRRVQQGRTIVFQLDVAERPVGVVYLDRRVLRLVAIKGVEAIAARALAQVDRLAVRRQGPRIVAVLEQLVALRLRLLGGRKGGVSHGC